MGLDTSHDCWHGPCSSFMAWRVALHQAITDTAATQEDLEGAWGRGEYADQSVPINVLMNHSDCDGNITPEQCAPLADALEALLPDLYEEDDDGYHLSPQGRTKAFIAGLRRAAAAGEAVEFH